MSRMNTKTGQSCCCDVTALQFRGENNKKMPVFKYDPLVE